jgi:hypothetical protein
MWAPRAVPTSAGTAAMAGTGSGARSPAAAPDRWSGPTPSSRSSGPTSSASCATQGTSAIAAAEAITLRRALDTLEEQQRTAIGLVVRGILAEAALRPELERIERERATLEPRLAAVEASGAPELPALAPELLSEIRARLEAGLTIESRQEIVRLLVGQIVIHGETSSDRARSTRAVVEYRFPGAVQTRTGTGSSPPRVRRSEPANGDGAMAPLRVDRRP